jgi:hypothetical protein
MNGRCFQDLEPVVIVLRRLCERAARFVSSRIDEVRWHAVAKQAVEKRAQAATAAARRLKSEQCQQVLRARIRRQPLSALGGPFGMPCPSHHVFIALDTPKPTVRNG